MMGFMLDYPLANMSGVINSADGIKTSMGTPVQTALSFILKHKGAVARAFVFNSLVPIR